MGYRQKAQRVLLDKRQIQMGLIREVKAHYSGEMILPRALSRDGFSAESNEHGMLQKYIEHQVDGEIDEGKGDAGDAVEPKSGWRGQVSPRHDPYVVVVLEFVGIKADEEL
jgi:hypothetical protein